MPALLGLAAALVVFAFGIVVGHRFGMAEGYDEARRWSRDDTDEAGA